MDKTYDIALSFDTTGSMYPCLAEVRRNMRTLINRMFSELSNLRISIIAHGDYCDEKTTYLLKMIDFTNDKDSLIKFVNNVEATCGGDYPEAYEYVLHTAKSLSWQSINMRALVIIGDAPPHSVSSSKYNMDWREEAKQLFGMKVNIYTIQCLDYGNKEARTFYKEVAQTTNGYHLKLNQFSHVRDILLAVCYKQIDDESVLRYEKELGATGLTSNMQRMFDIMLNRKKEGDTEEEEEEDDMVDGSSAYSRTRTTTKKKSKYDADDDTIKPCNGAKFQVFNVEADTSIKDFVVKMGLTFKTGRGFYEFTKPEIITDNKEIILMKKTTGELYEGAGTRKLANIVSDGGTRKLKPSDIPEYRVFIQSTSANRKLIGDTGFLYEVDGFGTS